MLTKAIIVAALTGLLSSVSAAPIPVSSVWEPLGLYENCGAPSDPVTVNSLDFIPNPPIPGQTVTVSGTGVSSVAINAGKALISVKLGPLTLLNEEEDICSYVSCPVAAGENVSITYSEELPGFMPKGKYTVTVNLVDESGKRLACVRESFQLAKPQAAIESGYKMTDSEARSKVTAAGIPVVSSGGCTDRNKSYCTSLEQVNSGSIDGILTLKRASACSFSITGGTETGHASGTYSHWNGYKIDISKGSCIDSYVKNNFTYMGLRGDGYPQWKSASGNIYCDEGNHWDILYY